MFVNELNVCITFCRFDEAFSVLSDEAESEKEEFLKIYVLCRNLHIFKMSVHLGPMRHELRCYIVITWQALAFFNCLCES